MTSVTRSSFTRNLRGYLGSSGLSRSPSAAGIKRISRSFAADPIEPIDNVPPSPQDHYDSPDHLDGFQNVTRQLLASDVLSSLIQTQSDLLKDEGAVPYEPDMHSAHATQVYRTARDGFPGAA